MARLRLTATTWELLRDRLHNGRSVLRNVVKNPAGTDCTMARLRLTGRQGACETNSAMAGRRLTAETRRWAILRFQLHNGWSALRNRRGEPSGY
ncbi:hypothetical protein TWF192_011315 [Orbilia oligospora]|nr:hypothetical protein TWF192_011315 [Orbilia oligospora]